MSYNVFCHLYPPSQHFPLPSPNISIPRLHWVHFVLAFYSWGWGLSWRVIVISGVILWINLFFFWPNINQLLIASQLKVELMPTTPISWCYYIWLEFTQILCILSLWVHVHLPYCVWKTLFPWSHPPPHFLHCLSAGVSGWAVNLSFPSNTHICISSHPHYFHIQGWFPSFSCS